EERYAEAADAGDALDQAALDAERGEPIDHYDDEDDDVQPDATDDAETAAVQDEAATDDAGAGEEPAPAVAAFLERVRERNPHLQINSPDDADAYYQQLEQAVEGYKGLEA